MKGIMDVLDGLSKEGMSPLQAAKHLTHKYNVDNAQECVDWYVNHVNPRWASEFRHA